MDPGKNGCEVDFGRRGKYAHVIESTSFSSPTGLPDPPPDPQDPPGGPPGGLEIILFFPKEMEGAEALSLQLTRRRLIVS